MEGLDVFTEESLGDEEALDFQVWRIFSEDILIVH